MIHAYFSTEQGAAIGVVWKEEDEFLVRVTFGLIMGNYVAK